MDPRFTESGKGVYVTAGGAGEQKKVIKTSPGKAFSIDIANVAGGIRFVWGFDAVTDAGVVLAFPPFSIPAGGFVSMQWNSPVEFAIGLTIASSTTQATYTAAGADLMMRVVSK